eukprot:6554043-Prymnesium_polylepis.4
MARCSVVAPACRLSRETDSVVCRAYLTVPFTVQGTEMNEWNNPLPHPLLPDPRQCVPKTGRGAARPRARTAILSQNHRSGSGPR